MSDTEDLVYRLRKRAEIRRQIPSRKSVQEGKADRLADLLEEAAAEIERLRVPIGEVDQIEYDEDGQPSAWLVLYNEVPLGAKLSLVDPQTGTLKPSDV